MICWLLVQYVAENNILNFVVCCVHQMSRLVASEVIRGGTLATRVAVIEKWVAVADICRCLHNYNGVLQVCAAFQNSSVFRLKKTWEKVSKTVSESVSVFLR